MMYHKASCLPVISCVTRKLISVDEPFSTIEQTCRPCTRVSKLVSSSFACCQKLLMEDFGALDCSCTHTMITVHCLLLIWVPCQEILNWYIYLFGNYSASHAMSTQKSTFLKKENGVSITNTVCKFPQIIVNTEAMNTEAEAEKLYSMGESVLSRMQLAPTGYIL